ncbi:MAG: hypothetical protein AMXMBFR7_40920 [Planctomycetota bacterium]
METLIRQLSDDAFEVREAAETELGNRGEQAQAAARAALSHEDPEVRQRCRRIDRILTLKQAEAAYVEAVHAHWPKNLESGRLTGPLLGAVLRNEAEGQVSKPGGPSVIFNATDFGFADLQGLQDSDGHWDAMRLGAERPADVDLTALTLLSYLGSGHTERVGAYKLVVRTSVGWLIARQRDDGAVRMPGWTQVDGVSHALAGLALAEASGMGRIPETKMAAQRAVDYALAGHLVVKDGQPFGFSRVPLAGQPDLFTTTLFVMHLKSAKVAGLAVKPEAFEGAIRFLDAVEHNESRRYAWVPGGKPSTQASFMACLARQFMGSKKEELLPYAEAALADFAGPTTGQAESDELTNWMGTLVLFQQGGDLWKAWNEKLKGSLCSEQGRADAGKVGRWSGCGVGFASSLNALCLEVYYRYLPLLKD